VNASTPPAEAPTPAIRKSAWERGGAMESCFRLLDDFDLGRLVAICRPPLARTSWAGGERAILALTVRDNNHNALQGPILTANSAELKGIAYCQGLA
jgi:hypothetical protein